MLTGFRDTIPAGAILYIFLLSSGAALRATVLSSYPTIFLSPLLCVKHTEKSQDVLGLHLSFLMVKLTMKTTLLPETCVIDFV